MKVEDVQKRLDEIKSMVLDDEVAHIEEDWLHFEVLESIANGTAENPVEMAKIAIQTAQLDFARWHA